ncbi:phospholipid binding protein [Trichosporon asahii var. asahii CBS 2479]|uniref:Phospholipid binding protein n=1 Tax=Trichosporon asahii var. asahii (strain ATCC 90039 / CBS 2479 / JCM 2466 / KCTC 7840 / NBRC 103889/ NCYC 2677 / UAMH 7654) TaxID=1186058 RepID=J6EY19_TRIAS|nr:phospholipid binding protein [Trichosporon asahii var. asahii CBS 2479]EJT49524.1 phospholipid binding protein [Trichosporon asahii var. asahii CBS 2479]
MALVVTAVHTFVAEHDDELEFQAGDKITVIEKDEAFGDGWWRGRNTKGEEGLFPATYISESSAETTSAAAPPASTDAQSSAIAQQPAAPVDAGVAGADSAKGPNGLQDSAPATEPIPPTSQQVPAAAAAVPGTVNGCCSGANAPASVPPTSGPANGINGHASEDEGRQRDSLLDESGAPRSAVTTGAAAQKPAGNVMGSTIDDVQGALEEHIASSPSSTRGLKNFETDKKDGFESRDQTDDEGGMGITSDARARLAEQAKLANEERDRQAQRESGGVAGLIYSDESDDEDDESHHSRRGSGINGDRYHQQHMGGGIARGNSTTGSHGYGISRPEQQLAPVTDADYSPPQQQQQRLPQQQQQHQQQVPYQSQPAAYQRSPEPAQAATMPPVDHVASRSPGQQAVETIPPVSHPEGPHSAAQSPEMHSGSTLPPGAAAAGTGATIAGVTAAAATAAAYRQGGAPAEPSPPASNDSRGAGSPALTPSARSSSLPSRSPLVGNAALPPTPSPQKAAMAPLPSTGSAPGSVQGTPHTDAVEQLQPALPLPPTPNNANLANSQSSQAPQSVQSPTSATPVTPGTAARMPKSPPNTWTVNEVVEWAHSRGFDQSVCDKFIEHDISGDVLLELDANLLKELDIPQFGKRIRIAQAINELRRPASHGSANSIPQGGVDQGHGRNASMPPSSYTGSVYGGSNAAEDQQGWGGSHSRKVSTTPSTQPIDESRVADVHPHPASTPTHSHFAVVNNANGGTSQHPHGTPSQTPHSSTIASSTQRSSASTPASPSTTVVKRDSSSSLGHKKGKGSMDKSDRLSFFGRARKPAPAQPPGSHSSGPRLPFTKQTNTMTADRPEKRMSSSNGTQAPIGGALQKIGKPDKTGYLKKRGERYNTWKQRFFVLKGSHLYYLKSENEDRVKGHIDLKGHRIIVDENTNPGNYGFRLVGPGNEKVHYFSWPERTQIRDWMKALMKATIARDYSVPVTSSCNIPTIPLAEAQALQPRPPSPSEREAVQRANRRENANQLTPRDASVLMALDTTGSGGKLMSGHMSLMPSRPGRDTRRASTGRSSNGGRPISSVGAGRPNSTGRPSIASYYPPDDDPNPQAADLMQWVNRTLPPQYPRVAHWPNSFVSGEVIFLIVKHLAGLEPVPPVPASAFSPDQSGLANVDGLFAMMDIVIDAGIDSAGVSLNDIRAGDAHAITQLLQGVRGWAAQRGFP